MLQYDNLSKHRVKSECVSYPVGQKWILEIVKLAKMANFLFESASESGSSFVQPFKESECYTNINFNEILLKNHWFVKF